MRQPLIPQLRSLATDRWARAGVRRLLRAAWLGACVWCVGLGGRLLLGWPLRPELLDAIALAIIGVAVASLLRPRLTPREAARRLDRRFGLNEQLSTAAEVAATNPDPGTLAARLVAQSEQTAQRVSRRIARQQRPPWNELITLVAVALVALGLYALAGVGRADPHVSAGALPPLAAPPDPAQQFPAEPPASDQQALVPDPNGQPAPSDQGAPGAQGAPGNQGGQGAPSASGAADPAIARALADALRNQGATRPAADALDRGDPSGAAQRLRELADQSDQLGQAARNDLADALRNAADQIAPRNQALADQVRRSADGLQRGGQDASKALDDLAQAIEQTQGDPSMQGQGPGQGAGQEGQGQGQGAGQDQGAGQGQGGEQGQGAGQGQGGGSGESGADGSQRQADPSDRLGVEGQPLPLDAPGDQLGPPQPSDKPPTSSDIVPGFVHGDDSSDKPVSTGEDPLRVPLDERDVVQGYFTP